LHKAGPDRGDDLAPVSYLWWQFHVVSQL
jgi:hypothetical protein